MLGVLPTGKHMNFHRSKIVICLLVLLIVKVTRPSYISRMTVIAQLTYLFLVEEPTSLSMYLLLLKSALNTRNFSHYYS